MTIYDEFREYNKEYVDLALKTMANMPNAYELFKKKFGPNFDGVNAVGTRNYMEDERLERGLYHLAKRVNVIEILKEEYNETNEKILKRFEKKNDTAIIQMVNEILNHRLTSDEVDEQQETEKKPVKMVNSPITKKEDVNKKRKTTQSTRKVIKPINKKLFKPTLFDYFINSRMTEKTKIKRKELVIKYLENTPSLGKDVAIKLYTNKYDNLNLYISTTDQEKEYFDSLINGIRNHINNKNSKKKIKRNLSSYLEYFNEDNLNQQENKIIMQAVKEYIDKSHSSYKDILIKYYGKNYDKKIDNISRIEEQDLAVYRREIKRNLFIEIKPSVVEYIFTKRALKELKSLLFDILPEYMENYENIKNILIKIYGEYYNSYNENVEINNYEKYLLRTFFNEHRKELSNITKKRKHNDEIKERKQTEKAKNNAKKYKPALINYFVIKSTNEEVKEQRREKILKYLEGTTLPGKDVALKLYSNEYSDLNIDVDLTEIEEKQFQELIDVLSQVIHEKKGRNKIELDSFLDYFSDDIASEEENSIIKKLVKAYIDKRSGNAKELVIKYYGPNYDSRNNEKMSSKEKSRLVVYCNDIKRYFIGEIKPSLYECFFDNRTKYISKEKFLIEVVDLLEKHEDIKNILVGIYGENYDTYNSEVKISNYQKYLLKQFFSENHKIIVTRLKSDTCFLNQKSFLDNFIDGSETFLEKEFVLSEVKEFIDNDKGHNKDLIVKIYGPNYNEAKDNCLITRRTYFNIHYYIKRIKGRIFFNHIRQFYRLFVGGPCSKQKEEKVLSVLKDIVLSLDPTIRDLIIKIYGENLDCINKDIKLTIHEKIMLKNSIQEIKIKFVEKYQQAKRESKEKQKRNYDTSYYNYFIDTDINTEESKTIIGAVKAYIDNDNSEEKNLLIKYYGESYDKRNDLPMSENDRYRICTLYNNRIHYNIFCRIKPNIYGFIINKTYKGQKYMLAYQFLQEKLSKNKVIRDIFQKLYGKNYDKYNENVKLSNYELYLLNVFIENFKEELADFVGARKRKTKLISNSNNNHNSREFTNLKENIFDYFIKSDMTVEQKEQMVKLFENYLATTESAGKKIYDNLYDENYNLIKRVKLSKEDKQSFVNFRETFRRFVLPKVYDVKLTNSFIDTDIDMFDLGSNGYLALTNDLFDIAIIDQVEILECEDNSQLDNLILNVYKQLNNSQEIMNILNISEATLLDFYLRNLEVLDNTGEAYNFILTTKQKDAIKMLFYTPLFQKNLEFMSEIERKVLYLKLIQVGNSKVTDEVIASLTSLPVEDISAYIIYSKEDKINDLNLKLSKK